MAALKSGASCAHVTVNGLGERAGNTPFEEVVMALEVLYDYRTRIQKEEIYPLSSLVSRLTGCSACREQGNRRRDGLHP